MPALGSPTSCYFSIFFIETKCIISLVCLCIFQPMMAIPVNDSLAFALLSKDSLDVAPKNWDSVRPEKLQWFFKFRSTNATTKIPPYFFAPKLVFFCESQPLVLCTKAQGLHCPAPCQHEPMDGSSAVPEAGSEGGSSTGGWPCSSCFHSERKRLRIHM